MQQTRRLQTNIADEHRCKIPTNILTNKTQQHINTITHADRVGFSLRDAEMAQNAQISK